MLRREFQRKYPYHYEDFVSDNYQSTRYVAYNFAKKQAALMKQGSLSVAAVSSRKRPRAIRMYCVRGVFHA